MRSLLMVPGHRAKCLFKCVSLGADALVFDLEDSVPPDKKDGALTFVEQFTRDLPPSMQTFARLNPERMGREMAVLKGKVTGFMIPKVKTINDVPWPLSDRIPLLLVIETPMAILKLEELFGVSNVIGGVFGVGDYSAAMGVIDRPWQGKHERFAYAKQKLATVARAYGKMALDTSFMVKGPTADFSTRIQWQQAASWGFTGASPIHPAHIPIANEVFSVPPREVDWSENVIEESERRYKEVYIDEEGCVVGPPHVKQAEGRLEWLRLAR